MENRNNGSGGCLTVVLAVILFLFLWIFVLSQPAYATECMGECLEVVEVATQALPY